MSKGIIEFVGPILFIGIFSSAFYFSGSVSFWTLIAFLVYMIYGMLVGMTWADRVQRWEAKEKQKYGISFKVTSTDNVATTAALEKITQIMKDLEETS